MVIRGLGHVNDLLISEFSIEICTLDVDLMELKILSSGDSKDSSC
jgi:hypothetical protein